MKKTISKLFVALLFGVCLFFSCFLYSINVYGFSSYNDNSIVSYDESYLLNQLDDYRNSLNMNTEDFDIYNTSDLIEEIICSQFNYIYYFNSMENGLNIFKKNNLYFKELLTRNDASDALMSLYNELNLSRNDRMINLKNYRLEVLLEQTEILNLFSSDELSQLDSIKFVREKQKLECESYNYSKNLQEIALLSPKNNSAPYTPNGNEVDYATLFSGNDFTPEEIESMTYNDKDKLGFTSNIRLSNPTKKYNCHSYAWYSQNTYNNNYWIDFPNSYIEDNSYDVGLGKKDDIICYFAKYYVYYSGEFHSISDPYIAHSAIISNVGLNFNKTNLDTYSELTVTSKWGKSSLFSHNAIDCPYVSAMYVGESSNGSVYSIFCGYQIYKPRTNASYTLSNYSSAINESLTIDSSTQLIDKYEMYELNVNYTKNYEFNIQANDLLDVRLYDEHMQLVSFNDLDNNLNKVHFIKTLQNTKTYYLRVSYDDGESTGTISTQIASRTTAYLSYNTQNDILLNTYNGIHDYYFINDRGAGFYKFKLTGTNIEGTTFTYPANAIKIYNDTPKNSSNLLEKYSLTGYTNHAQNKYSEDSFIVCLPRNGYFYLDVNVPSTNLASLTIEVLPLYNEEIDLFDLSESSNTYLPIMSSSTKGDYFEALELNQTGKFVINATYDGSQTDDILFVLAEKAYNASTNSYYINPISVYLMDNYYNSYSITRTLTEGTYYIGYFNKDDTSDFSVSLNRLVTQSGANALLVDPGSDWDCGSQINIIEMYSSNKSYNSTNITEGFTRIIYMNEPLGLSGSRLDYYWYSSNESIATVTNYGTVLGRNAGMVKIMAVLKEDPSKVFVKQFTIIEDDGTGYTPVESNYIINYSDTDNGTFHLELEDVLCPYPWYQYYTWSTYVPCQYEDPLVTNDTWGNYTVSGPGTFDLTGQFYIYNTVYITVVVIIHVTVTNN